MLNKFNFFAKQMHKLQESLDLSYRNRLVFPVTLAPPEYRSTIDHITFSTFAAPFSTVKRNPA